MVLSSEEFGVGNYVWVEHYQLVWCPARITNTLSNGKISIKYLLGDDKEAVIKKKQIHSQLTPECFESDLLAGTIHKDLSKLKSLSIPVILDSIRNAYREDVFYVSLGPGTILALNPFKVVSHLFEDDVIELYNSVANSDLLLLPPHIYSVAERALRDMRNGLTINSQSIVVSGESGAGKTWSVCSLMRYFALASNKGNLVDHEAQIQSDKIEYRILSSNPVLEAFGNASTRRNSNSSRFGKYIQLQYNHLGNIIGASLEVYLLEKTRAARNNDLEQTFHIFYQMMRGASQQEVKDWQLPDKMTDMSFDESIGSSDSLFDGSFEAGRGLERLSTSSSEMKYDDGGSFQITRHSMSCVGIIPSQQNEIFKILSALLHIKSLCFEQDEEDNVANPCFLQQSCVSSGQIASSLLQITLSDLMNGFTTRLIETGGKDNTRKSVFRSVCSINECSVRKEALIKIIYKTLFSWIVDCIAKDISADANQVSSFIGLLDVFGFESFKTNSLEQLCINYANEKLQYFYVQNFLKLQQLDLAAKGIKWEILKSKGEDSTLFSLESPQISLFALMNEECRLNREHDASHFQGRIQANFGRNKFITLPRISRDVPCFTVKHYAGDVTYNTQDLVFKNKDEVPAEMISLLSSSNNDFLKQLNFDKVVSEKLGSKLRKTVVYNFKHSLDKLLMTISSTNCHYIRCIKPNRDSLPSTFDAFYIVDQLCSNGIVETVQMCSSLLPHRIEYPQFIHRFSFLVRNTAAQEIQRYKTKGRTEKEAQALVRKICSSCPTLDINNLSKHLQFGKNCLFLSNVVYESLLDERSKGMLDSAKKIQLLWRKYIHMKRCRHQRKQMIHDRVKAASIIQNSWREFRYRARCRQLRKVTMLQRKKAATVLQRHWRQYMLVKQRRLERINQIQIGGSHVVEENHVEHNGIIETPTRAVSMMKSLFEDFQESPKRGKLLNAGTQGSVVKSTYRLKNVTIRRGSVPKKKRSKSSAVSRNLNPIPLASSKHDDGADGSYSFVPDEDEMNQNQMHSFMHNMLYYQLPALSSVKNHLAPIILQKYHYKTYLSTYKDNWKLQQQEPTKAFVSFSPGILPFADIVPINK